MEPNLSITLISLLLIACIIALLAKWIDVPYTVALVFVGLIISMTGLASEIKISREIIFTAILPPLIFYGAFHMNIEQLKADWKSIILLAIPGVLISTLITGFLIHWFWNISLAYGLLFGALITPTDPISVLAILKKVNAPNRLRIILEGESLFNDGTGIVLFTLISGIIWSKNIFTFQESLLNFTIIVLGSSLLGIGLGYLGHKILGKINDHLIEVTLTIIIAFGTPIIAEIMHLSGIIAVVFSGLIIGNYGRQFSMSTKTRETVETFWEVVDFLINSLIFLAIGIELQVITLHELKNFSSPIIYGIIAILLTRAFIIYPFIFFQKIFKKESIPWAWTHTLFWGGLRGSIPIALAVGLEDFEYRDLFLTSTFAIVLFSLLFQGFTMKSLIKYSKLTHV